MTENTGVVESTNTDVGSAIGNISDQQVDKFFDSKGEADVFKDESESEGVRDNAVSSERNEVNLGESEQKHEEKSTEFDRNYKAALQEERQRRYELHSQLKEQQARAARLEQQFQEFSKRLQSQDAPEKEPSPEEDPIGHLQWQNRHLNNQLKAHNEYLHKQYEQMQARAAQEQQAQKHQRFISNYESQAKEYLAGNPEFKGAYNFLNQSRTEEYMAAGFSKEQSEQLLIEDELAVVSRAMMDGVNPAERIYKIAQTRGYKKAAQPKLEPMKEELPMVEERKSSKLDFLSKGIENSKSLGTNGATEGSRVKPSDVDEMDDAEFESFWNKEIKGSKGRRS